MEENWAHQRGVTACGTQPAVLVAEQWPHLLLQKHMSSSLNSLKRGYIREYIGDYYRGYFGAY